MIRLLPGVHDLLFAFLRVTTLRDRMRCPCCGKVGTWKIHGGLLGGGGRAHCRRWLCKWCGLYYGPEGPQRAHINPKRGHWTLEPCKKAWRPEKKWTEANPWVG